jgi:tRNA(fMet)-specific endonuclease VapC
MEHGFARLCLPDFLEILESPQIVLLLQPALQREPGKFRGLAEGCQPGRGPVAHTCIYTLKQNPTVLKHLLAHSREDIAVSVITEAELRTGAATSSAKTLRLVENFLRPLGIVEFTSNDAASYAQVRAKLERGGTPVGPLDTLIAAQAAARKLVLVSNNEREFRRVAGLRSENWTS